MAIRRGAWICALAAGIVFLAPNDIKLSRPANLESLERLAKVIGLPSADLRDWIQTEYG